VLELVPEPMLNPLLKQNMTRILKDFVINEDKTMTSGMEH